MDGRLWESYFVLLTWEFTEKQKEDTGIIDAEMY